MRASSIAEPWMSYSLSPMLPLSPVMELGPKSTSSIVLFLPSNYQSVFTSSFSSLDFMLISTLFSRVLRDFTPCYVDLSVGWSVDPLVGWSPFWAAAPKGRCHVGHRGKFPDIPSSVRTFAPPPRLLWPLSDLKLDL